MIPGAIILLYNAKYSGYWPIPAETTYYFTRKRKPVMPSQVATCGRAVPRACQAGRVGCCFGLYSRIKQAYHTVKSPLILVS